MSYSKDKIPPPFFFSYRNHLLVDIVCKYYADISASMYITVQAASSQCLLGTVREVKTGGPEIAVAPSSVPHKEPLVNKCLMVGRGQH